MHKKILLVDNYDSFTFNIKHLIEMFAEISLSVIRHDDPRILDGIQRGDYDGVIIGPGPGSAEDEAYFGFNKEIILKYGSQRLPILGICLGFQGIYHFFGGRLKLGKKPVHGKISRLIITQSSPLFQGVADFTPVMRYHSIVADTSFAVPECITITAYTSQGNLRIANLSEPMALEHKDYPIFGVQFHPESFATPSGKLIVKNFLDQT